MKVDAWLKIFKQNRQKKLFSLSDINQLVDESRENIAVELTRLVKKEVISRITRGWYTNPFNLPSYEEISMILRVPCYLSMEYALSRYGTLSQRAVTFTLITTQKPYIYKKGKEVYEYHQIKRSLFWGYKQDRDILIAEAEKALLDLIYIRMIHSKQVSIEQFSSLLDDMYKEDFNKNKLKKYAKQFGGMTQEILYHTDLVKK